MTDLFQNEKKSYCSVKRQSSLRASSSFRYDKLFEFSNINYRQLSLLDFVFVIGLRIIAVLYQSNMKFDKEMNDF